MATQQKKIQHLFLRAGFGETPARIKSLLNTPTRSIVDDLFETSNQYKDVNYLPYPLNESQEMKGAGAGKIVKMILQSKQDMEELNIQWIFKMTHTQAVLRERMTFFWHNHFATSTPFAYLMQVQNNMLRKHALGKFSDLLHDVAKDPAMIIYLNNQQNVKGSPNENFAREVLELFSMGVGNYTEQDIKEAARAFTGWTTNTKGEFEFQKAKHDDGEKIFLGRRGNFGGEEILNIILEQRQTSEYLVTKIYKEFVNPKPHKERIKKLSQQYFDSGYDTSALMRSILSSDWFYDDENIGVKISSPVELLVRFKKLIDLQFKRESAQLNYQKALGQVLFFPPNVAGWKGGQAWIDSTSLLLRLCLAQYALRGMALNLHARPAFEEVEEGDRKKERDDKMLADWSKLLETFKEETEESLPGALLESLVQCDHSGVDKKTLKSNNRIQTIVNVMSLPEFQLI